jgi:hypothetical protein
VGFLRRGAWAVVWLGLGLLVLTDLACELFHIPTPTIQASPVPNLENEDDEHEDEELEQGWEEALAPGWYTYVVFAFIKLSCVNE